MHIITIDSDEKSVLYQKATPITLPLSKVDMADIEAMRIFYQTFSDKAGFAAPQVGISKRIILIERELYDGTPSDEPVILINPAWKALDNEQAHDFEGCLSVPGKNGIVRRYCHVTLTAEKYDLATRTTKTIERDYHHEFSCALWQHEIDHLDGQIYIDKAAAVFTEAEASLLQLSLLQTGQLPINATIFDLGEGMLKHFKNQSIL